MWKYTICLALAATLLCSVVPARAQCLTPETTISRAAELNYPVLGQFDDVTTPTGIHVDHFIVFEVDDHFDIVGFDKDITGRLCYSAYQSVDDDELDGFLAHVQRKAGPSI